MLSKNNILLSSNLCVNFFMVYQYLVPIINHSSGLYVGMTQTKHGHPYIRADHIFAENSLSGHFEAPKSTHKISMKMEIGCRHDCQFHKKNETMY